MRPGGRRSPPVSALRLAELELIDRERRLVERRIHAAHFPAVKSLDTFDFTAMPGLNKPLVLELARCEFVVARDNIIVLGNSGTGKTHMALALGLAACQRGFSVSFFTAKRKDAARERARGVIETMRRSWTQLCRAPAVGGERRPEASITPRPSSAPGTVIACARLTGTFGKTAIAVPRARINGEERRRP